MTIFEYLDKYITIPLNKHFAKRIDQFTKNYLLSDVNISSFYGGQTMGTLPITFKSSLVNNFYVDILAVDVHELMRARKKVDKIIPSHKVAGDLFNIVIFYLARRIEIEDKLPRRMRIQCQRNLGLIFCYRSLSALHNKYFNKYLIPNSLANRVVDAMSDLFILKRLGSWRAYMEYRVDKLYDSKRKEHRRLLSNDEDAFLSVIVKTQGAIRSTVKAIYAVYMKIRESDKRDMTRSIAVEIGEDNDIADITQDATAIINKTLSKITAKDVFINKEFINLICTEYVTKYDTKTFQILLEKFHKALSRPEGVYINNYFNDVLAYELHIIRQHLSVSHMKDPVYVVNWVKGVITSSRSRNEHLLKLRDTGSDLIKRVTKMSNRHYIVKSRIALMLYLLLLSY